MLLKSYQVLGRAKLWDVLRPGTPALHSSQKRPAAVSFPGTKPDSGGLELLGVHQCRLSRPLAHVEDPTAQTTTLHSPPVALPVQGGAAAGLDAEVRVVT